MEAQTLDEKIIKAKKRLEEAEAEYRAAKERNPDDPRLCQLYQGVLNCQQLLHDLYEKEKRLHQEQQALRETPAGNSLPSFFFCSSIIHVFVLFICI